MSSHHATRGGEIAALLMSAVMMLNFLADTRDELHYCLERFSCTPVDYIEVTGWLSSRTWVAHGVHFNDEEVQRLGRHKVGICHCPTSNMVLASGMCRTKELEAAGAIIGLGVDGSASNDNSNLFASLRHAMLINRPPFNTKQWTHPYALRGATKAHTACL